jgi:hypothetical protein
VDVAEGPLGVGIERLGVRLLATDVRVDGGNEAGLAELAQDDIPEAGLREGRRPERDQGLRARLSEAFLRGDAVALGRGQGGPEAVKTLLLRSSAR